MSRTLRSAALVAQSLAGPSRPVLRASTIPRLQATPSMQMMQTRGIFGGLGDLPNALRRAVRGEDKAKKADEPGATLTPEEAQAKAALEKADTAEGGLFDEVTEELKDSRVKTKHYSQHSASSGFHKGSHRKLNQISRQVATLPVDEAIIQLQHGEKRAGRTWVKSTLITARNHAMAKGLRRERLVVAETWVAKGEKIARVDPKGRGRMGIKHHGKAKIFFVLKEGKTVAEKEDAKRRKVLSKVRSAGTIREDGKIRRKFNSGWGW